tara:strand:- start:1574 stop:2239 length:666 start_codon:yes stop_codon:yes gene_type:complete
MADFIPEIIMDDAISDSEDSIEETTDIKVVEKSAIVEGDIFVDKTPKKNLVIKEVAVVDTPATPPPSPKAKQVKTRKKRVMTEEHKAKLSLAREKALAKRRENAARKKEIKLLHKEEEEQKFQQLKQRVRKPKQEKIMESSGVIEEEVKKELKKTNKNYTQEDLDNAVLNGIMKYEVIRKDRKKKKQEAKEINNHEEKVRQQVRQIINKPIPDYNYFDNCY